MTGGNPSGPRMFRLRALMLLLGVCLPRLRPSLWHRKAMRSCIRLCHFLHVSRSSNPNVKVVYPFAAQVAGHVSVKRNCATGVRG